MSLFTPVRRNWPSTIAAAAFGLFCLLTIPAGTGFAEDGGNLYNTPMDIANGQSYFERQCSRCHGFDAKGNDEAGAPDLTGQLRNASTDIGVFDIIRNGIPGTAMLPVSATLPDNQVWQLVAYINSLRYDPSLVELPGDADAGAALFSGSADCASCHMVNGVGGRKGPDLSRVGEDRTPEDLMAALINPNEDVSPRWWRLRLQGPDGVTREGYRMGEDSFSVRIMDEQENLWSFQKSQLQSYERIEQSTMPGYADSLSDSELDNLVAFLFSLRKEI
ncbi:MAG: c-type cytochrome [Gammaproteobacteria bacterium]